VLELGVLPNRQPRRAGGALGADPAPGGPLLQSPALGKGEGEQARGEIRRVWACHCEERRRSPVVGGLLLHGRRVHCGAGAEIMAGKQQPRLRVRGFSSLID